MYCKLGITRENIKDCFVFEKDECCLNSDLFVPIIL